MLDVATSKISLVARCVLLLLIVKIVLYKLELIQVVEFNVVIVPDIELILQKVLKPTISIVQGKLAGIPAVLYPPSTPPLFK